MSEETAESNSATIPEGYVPQAEVDKIKAGFESRISELTQRAKTAEAKASEVEQKLTSLTETHAVELKRKDDEIAKVKGEVDGARKETALVRHGIDDAEAKELLEFRYSKVEEGEDGSKPEFGEWLEGYVKEPPTWLSGYLDKQEAAPKQTDETPAETETAAAPEAANETPEQPKTPAPPIKNHEGAGSIGSKGELGITDLMNLSPEEYRAQRAKLLPGAKPLPGRS